MGPLQKHIKASATAHGFFGNYESAVQQQQALVSPVLTACLFIHVLSCDVTMQVPQHVMTASFLMHYACPKAVQGGDSMYVRNGHSLHLSLSS